MLVFRHFKDHYTTARVFSGPRGQSGCTLGVSRSILFGTFYTIRAVREMWLKYTVIRYNHSLAIYWFAPNKFFTGFWMRYEARWTRLRNCWVPLQSTFLLFPRPYITPSLRSNDDLMWLLIVIKKLLMVLGFGIRLILPLMALFSSFGRWKFVGREFYSSSSLHFLLSLSPSSCHRQRRHQQRSPEVSAALRRNIFW